LTCQYVEVLAWGHEIQNEGSNGASCPNPQEHDVQNELHTETITFEIPYALGLPLRASPAARPSFFPTDSAEIIIYCGKFT
jgi:hypothetical protein